MKYKIIKVAKKKYLTTNKDLNHGGDCYLAKEKGCVNDWEFYRIGSISIYKLLKSINPSMIRRKIIMEWP